MFALVCVTLGFGGIVGGGIAGMPFATARTGIWMGLSIHLLNVLSGVYSVHLLMNAKNFTHVSSFSQIGYFCFGRTSIFIINLVIGITCLGMSLTYFVIVGDVGNWLLSRIDTIEDTFWSSRQFAILTFAVILLFFILRKQIKELKYSGVIAVVGVTAFICTLAVKLIIDGQKTGGIKNFQKPNWDTDMVSHIPIIFLSYTFQSAFYSIFQISKNKSYGNAMRATSGSLVFISIIYVSISVIAIERYGSDLLPDILQNISNEGGVFSIIVECTFLLIATVTIPIVLFVGKEAVLIIIDEAMRKSYSKEPRPIVDSSYQLLSGYIKTLEGKTDTTFESEKLEGKQYLKMHPLLYYSLCFFTYAGVVTAACFLDDVNILFGIIGSVAGSFLIYILPALLYLRAAHIEKILLSRIDKVGAWVFLLFGLVVLVGCMTSTIYSSIAN